MARLPIIFVPGVMGSRLRLKGTSTGEVNGDPNLRWDPKGGYLCTSGAKLAARITEIVAEGKKVTGTCEKVILVTHSMGGLVARAAMKLSGAEGGPALLRPVDVKAKAKAGSFNGDSPDSPSPPGHRTFPKLEHQPVYEQALVKTWATAAITAIAGLRFKELKG